MNNLDLWHHWLLLRPLLTFVLALPLIVLALVFRGRGEQRSREKETQQAAASTGANAQVYPNQGPETHAEAGPRPWPGGSVGSDRRAA